MNATLRFSPFKLALAYIGLSAAVLVLFALPLWYAWRVNLAEAKTYVRSADVAAMAALLEKEGPKALAAQIDARVARRTDDEVILFADASRNRIAGNVQTWPSNVPNAAGMSGMAIDQGGGSTMRFVGAHVDLPGGFHLLIGRESARFQSLVELFWYSLAGATAAILLLGVAGRWLIRRALLSDVHKITAAASAIVSGDVSRRLPTGGSAGELDELCRAVNGMLEQLAAKNEQLANEVAVRRRAEEALQRARDTLEELVERRTAELARANERYELALAASGEGFWDWRVATDEYYVSPRTLEILGLSPDAVVTKRADFLAKIPFHPEDRRRWEEAISAQFAGLAQRFDIEVRLIVGSDVRWVHLTGLLARDPSGAPVRWSGAVADITDRKQAEERLRQSERDLQKAQRLEAVGTLAGGLAHDFNNILGAILGYGEMALRDAPEGTRLRRDVDSILAAGKRGTALVDRILAFSRSGMGERIPVHVEKVVREALDFLAATLPDNVRVETHLDAGRAAMMGDPTQVHQVVMNLATNAVQAMPSGGTLRVSLEQTKVDVPRAATIGAIARGDYLLLRVADQGTGIAPEILDRIFDPFFTTKEVSVGTGLGLSLVHGIVGEVGGAIDVTTGAEKGTTFTVYLPRSGEVVDVSAEEPATPPRGERQHILVVDDEESLLTLVCETLEDLGYVPIGFTSGIEAIAAFRADPKQFDLVISDERMPGLPGSTLIQEMRRIQRAIPILLVSGYVGGMVTSRAYNAGATEVLKKPLSASELAAAVARVLPPQPRVA